MMKDKRSTLYTLVVLVFIACICKMVLAENTMSVPLETSIHRFKQNDLWGFIDRNGVIKIEPRYLYADEFSEGLAAVAIPGETDEDGLYGFIDLKGDFVIEPQYYSACSFSEGLAMVEFEVNDFGCIDKEGKIVFRLPEFARPFKEGLACAYDPDRDGMGYIDRNGKWMIAPKYWPASSFAEGLASVAFKGEYGYVNSKGEEVIPLQYFSAGNFQEGLAWVQRGKVEKGFYIDKTGERVKELDFPRIGVFFSEGLTYASIDHKYYGYVNQKGEWVIQPRYTIAYNFSEGLAFVMSGDTYCFIDKKGGVKILVEGMTDCIEGFKNGLARVIKDKKEVFINTEGKVVFTVQ